MARPHYYPLEALLNEIQGAQGVAVRSLYAQHWNIFAASPGSASSHQAWAGTSNDPGGYIAHVTDMGNIALQLFTTLSACRTLPFTIGDVLLVVAIHDIEKPFRYVLKHPAACGTKVDRARFRQELCAGCGLELTAAQSNALQYVEGENADYTPGERRMGPLGALVSSADLLSARLWFDEPAGDDLWSQSLFARTPLGGEIPKTSAP